jgi:hypothetical protein
MIASLGLGMIGDWVLQLWKDSFVLSTTRIRRLGRGVAWIWEDCLERCGLSSPSTQARTLKNGGCASGFWHISIACNQPLTPPSPRERGEGEQLEVLRDLLWKPNHSLADSFGAPKKGIALGERVV